MHNIWKLLCIVIVSMLASCVTEAENDAHTINLLGGSRESSEQDAFTSIYGVSLRGSTNKLFGVGTGFEGGFVWNPSDSSWYAISQDAQELSTLYRIRPSGGKDQLIPLGNRFDRGLAYRNADKRLYALSRDGNGIVSLNRINLAGGVIPVAVLGEGYFGLTYDPVADQFYSLQTDSTAFASLTRVSPSGVAMNLFGIGRNFKNGLAYHPGRGVFYAVAEDEDGFGSIYEIKLGGQSRRLFGLGFDFRDASVSLARNVPAPGLWRRSPISGERFVAGEQILFDAAVTLASASNGYEVANGSEMIWSSNVDGVIGSGGLALSSSLSVGEHEITVSGYGFTETVMIRVFSDLGAFYIAEPSPSEISRIRRGFEFKFLDGNGPDENWAPYRGNPFAPSATGPSDLRVIALLDLMRHQKFSEPLPMTGGQSIYDHFRAYTPEIEMRLDCGVSAAQAEGVTLNRSLSQWISSDSGANCKQTPPQASLTPYILATSLLVHEGRHLQSDDPSHTDCTGGGSLFSDQKLQDGSGHAWSALYAMWVYKYGLYDSVEAKTWARSLAQQTLESRFCEAPTHSNPTVQAIIDELLMP